MNYEDEYGDEEDEYSHSVEDNYCISPSTAAQFTWTREKNMNLAAYVGQEEVINEEEEETQEDVGHDSFNDSSKSLHLGLSDFDKAKLNSCLDEARNILGDSVSESVMTSVIIQNGYNLETSINQLLSQQDLPKPQREPRQRKIRTQDLDNLLAEIERGGKPVVNHGYTQSAADINSIKSARKDLHCDHAPKSSKENFSKPNLPISLSDLVKQYQGVDTKTLSSSGEEMIFKTQTKKDLAQSFTDVAQQQNASSPIILAPTGVPSKAHHAMSLSCLIAKETPNKDLATQGLSPHTSMSLGNLAPATKNSTSSLQVTTPSLSDLVKLHSSSQSDTRKSNLSFPQSASTTPFVKNNILQSDLCHLIKKISLDQSNSQEQVQTTRSTLLSSLIPDNFSLASCLKTKKPSLPSLNPSKKPLTEENTWLIKSSMIGDGEVNVQPSVAKATVVQKADAKLLSGPSSVGLVLCGLYGSRKRGHCSFPVFHRRNVKYPRFVCDEQLSRVPMYTLPVKLHDIKPFDFSTPSPDDIVKSLLPATQELQPKDPEVINLSSPLVTPSKSASKVKATVGFLQAEDQQSSQPNSPASSKKLSIQVGSIRNVSSAGPKKDKGKRELSNLEQRETESKVSEMAATALSSEDITVGGNSIDSNLRNAVEFMGLEGDKQTIQSSVDSMKPVPATPKSKGKSSKIDVMAEFAKRHGNKELLNLVVIGHVDAGKSTLMGHLLYQLGNVNKKTMHKYEQESKKIGKSSFAFAWVLDETEEERERGVTMDVAQNRFETEKKCITLLDAPGHKDFIPNMITGASQADVAILVINATRGEFETGFDAGGQTREHALLARSLGVGQIIVAVNKMDTVEWNYDRYESITKKIGQFLTKQAGFKESDICYVPCSGLIGENLTKPSTEPKLTSWYKSGITLLQQIENLKPPVRPIDKPFRLHVSDVFKGVGTGFNVAGRVGAGYVQSGDKILIMPLGNCATVKNIYIDDVADNFAFAGDHVNLTLSGVDMSNVSIGSCLCDPNTPARSATRVRAKIVIFNIDLPITKGYPVVFHYQSINEPAIIKRLLSQLHRSTGEVIKKNPRCLVKNTSAVVEIELERPVCMELYSEFKDLGRFMLRSGGHTIAAGLVEETVQTIKTSVNGTSQS
ncbi:HBS1-like protein isoform X1 [Biomphalaria pfeifferi]|uniref:HBS1-like protein isoform X1 n=1 Tax=Biomphalaria pfeifferi TaxID=112525 RepID=A0AAD8FM93_BIOPF|nr:HBS1-like protein isoform X1 [Biomphalaria pfeifferi]